VVGCTQRPGENKERDDEDHADEVDEHQESDHMPGILHRAG